MKELGLVDGRVIELDEAVVQMEDRGHQFGDGVYEVTKVYRGRCFALRPHLERLFKSLRELRIPAVYTEEELAGFHERLIVKSEIKEGYIYLQITRGVASRAHGFPEQMVPRLTMSIKPAAPLPEKLVKTGATAIWIPDERWLRCDIKSLNLLGNILGKQAAKEAGVFEGIMVRDGFVTEGTSTSFFVCKDGVLWTHPADNLILGGITRAIIKGRLAQELNVPVLEKAFKPEFVSGADEAFICGTNTEIMPIVQISGSKVGSGEVGAVTRALQERYRLLIAEECP